MLLAWKCKRLEIPLEAGGLFQQPVKATNDMLTAVSVYDVFKSRTETTDLVKWRQDNPEMDDYYFAIKELLEADGY